MGRKEGGGYEWVRRPTCSQSITRRCSACCAAGPAGRRCCPSAARKLSMEATVSASSGSRPSRSDSCCRWGKLTVSFSVMKADNHGRDDVCCSKVPALDLKHALNYMPDLSDNSDLSIRRVGIRDDVEFESELIGRLKLGVGATSLPRHSCVQHSLPISESKDCSTHERHQRGTSPMPSLKRPIEGHQCERQDGGASGVRRPGSRHACTEGTVTHVQSKPKHAAGRCT